MGTKTQPLTAAEQLHAVMMREPLIAEMYYANWVMVGMLAEVAAQRIDGAGKLAPRTPKRTPARSRVAAA